MVETVIVRPMAVYGPGDAYDRVIPLFCRQAIAGVPLTVRSTEDALIDFSYAHDIASGLALAAAEPAAAGEIFNLSYGQGRTLSDVVSAFQRHFPDLRYEVIYVPSSGRPRRGALDISKARDMLALLWQVRC